MGTEQIQSWEAINNFWISNWTVNLSHSHLLFYEKLLKMQKFSKYISMQLLTAAQKNSCFSKKAEIFVMWGHWKWNWTFWNCEGICLFSYPISLGKPFRSCVFFLSSFFFFFKAVVKFIQLAPVEVQVQRNAVAERASLVISALKLASRPENAGSWLDHDIQWFDLRHHVIKNY